MLSRIIFVVVASLMMAVVNAQPGQLTRQQQQQLKPILSQQENYTTMAMKIWQWAELGYVEQKSSALLQQQLLDNGFTVKPAVAGMPTAFVASYGGGGPVIAILAEFDALPGMSQQAKPQALTLDGQVNGHACGHHLFGVGSVAAAIAIKQWLKKQNLPGTVRLYGTPAEEGGSGKVYLVRAGLFSDADVVLHWHPADRNRATALTTLANKSARFTFTGTASHAAAAPERGRSALDGVEALNYMVNMMREHVPQQTRIHYIISQGGAAPNIVPQTAQAYYYVRHPNAEQLQNIWTRVERAAQGAALGTETQVQIEVMHGNHSVLPNAVLAQLMDKNLRSIGGVQYTHQDREFALQLIKSFQAKTESLVQAAVVLPYGEESRSSSTDVGDVSWMVPTVGLNTATWVPGTSAHSWQAVAAGGTEIGIQGMLNAAKTLTLTGIELIQNPQLIQKAKIEFEQRRGENFHYKALLGNRLPPLDYRVQ